MLKNKFWSKQVPSHSSANTLETVSNKSEINSTNTHRLG